MKLRADMHKYRLLPDKIITKFKILHTMQISSSIWMHVQPLFSFELIYNTKETYIFDDSLHNLQL